MTKEQQMKETEGATRDDFGQELTRLRSKIAEVRSDFQAVLDQIAEAEKSKQAAKLEYAACLDRGDEQGMSRCLTAIRQASSTVDRLQTESDDFPLRCQKLRLEQEGLESASRREKPLAEKTLQEAQETLRVVNAQINQARGLLTNLNNLGSFVRGEPERSM
jgi:chromosome segregation ATPase